MMQHDEVTQIRRALWNIAEMLTEIRDELEHGREQHRVQNRWIYLPGHPDGPDEMGKAITRVDRMTGAVEMLAVYGVSQYRWIPLAERGETQA